MPSAARCRHSETVSVQPAPDPGPRIPSAHLAGDRLTQVRPTMLSCSTSTDCTTTDLGYPSMNAKIALAAAIAALALAGCAKKEEAAPAAADATPAAEAPAAPAADTAAAPATDATAPAADAAAPAPADAGAAPAPADAGAAAPAPAETPKTN